MILSALTGTWWLKPVLFGAGALAIGAVGFERGYSWQSDNVANAEQAQAREAEGREVAEQKQEQAQLDYLQLRQQYGAAIEAAKIQTERLRQENQENAIQAGTDYEARLAALRAADKRIYDARMRDARATAAVSLDSLRSDGVPEIHRARCSKDATAQRELEERLRAADESEARLASLQALCAASEACAVAP